MENRPLRILVADDEDGLRMSMAGILEMEGYEVFDACDGKAAVETAAAHGPFDIAFLDIKMPGLNGVEVFKEIKKICPETVVIIMTAYAVNDLIREAINEGAYACINKPFDMDKVIATIKDVQAKPFVVVIDDDTVLCELMNERLKELGYNVVTRSSGEQGIELVQRKIPDIVFLDVVMEGMDGVATLRKMKDLLGENCPKTIIMSAHDFGDKFDEARQIGAAQCLNKPLDLGALQETIDHILGKNTPLRICVVDDDRESCEVLKQSLAIGGYDVDVAYSGAEVLEKIKKEVFKIVVLNMKQPDINGVEIYDKIKQVNNNVGVIFVDSAAAGDSTVPTNNYTYLHKPFELDELIALIEQIKKAKFSKKE